MAHLGLLMAVCLCIHWQFVAAARKLLSIEKKERNEQKLPGYTAELPANRRSDLPTFLLYITMGGERGKVLGRKHYLLVPVVRNTLELPENVPRKLCVTAIAFSDGFATRCLF